MHHMKKTTVRDLRYHFPEIEARLNKGEEIILHKRRRVIARLVPVRPDTGAYPDFSALRRGIFGKKKARKTGTEIVSEGRDRY
jgi:antitoxin (DNA-binding transcriptional repressor) of toxin-antitoxin stability system